MSKTKFTSAPWGTDRKEHDTPYQDIKIVAGWRSICKVWIDDAPVPDFNQEQLANAHLITTAPKMYAALVEALRIAPCNAHEDDELAAFYEQVRAILAEARGET